jgi:MSHA biogenesis protein MshO
MRRTGFDAMRRRAQQHGFTLVELIVSITLLGILAVVAVPMLRTPMAAYMDAQHRADLAAELDASVAKMRDDLAQALPNSVRRTTLGPQQIFIEFLQVRAWGRYRTSAKAAACPNDQLEFGLPGEGCFTALGPLQGAAPVAGSDWVIANPIGPGSGVGGDPYFGGATAPAGGVKSRLLAAPLAVGTETRITVTPHSFALEPAVTAHQFYIVSGPVSYECNKTTGRLTRYAGYAIAAAQPTAFGAGVGTPLATLINDCDMRPTATGAAGRGGIVSLWLKLSLPSAGTGMPESVESFTVVSMREPA